MDAKGEFEKLLMETFVGYQIGMEPPPTKPLAYVLAGGGAFEVRTNRIGLFVRKDTKVDGLPPLAEGFTWSIQKIPWDIFTQVVTFFRSVTKRYGSVEAYTQVFWDGEKYSVHVPKQRVSGGHVSFTRDVELERQKLLVLEAHSHNSMGAFFSHTDNGDERADRLFMVVGALEKRTPEVKLRAGMGGVYIDLGIEDVFEPPVGEPITQEWLEQVQAGESVARRELAKMREIVGDVRRPEDRKSVV